MYQGSSRKDRERRNKLQEQVEEQLREATQVKAFVSAGSQKIAEKGLRDGSTLAERTQAMLERKRKAREEQQAKEEEELKNKSKQTILNSSFASSTRAALRSSTSSIPTLTSASSPRRQSPPSKSKLRNSSGAQMQNNKTPRRARIITYGDSPPSSKRVTGHRSSVLRSCGTCDATQVTAMTLVLQALEAQQ